MPTRCPPERACPSATPELPTWCLSADLEHRQRSPSLYPQGSTGAVRIVAQWADSTLFWAAMGYSFSPAGAAYMFKDQSPEDAKAFAEDRGKMRAGSGRILHNLLQACEMTRADDGGEIPRSILLLAQFRVALVHNFPCKRNKTLFLAGR